MKNFGNFKRLLIAAALVGLAPAWALQNVDVSDGRSHLVNISAKEMTRIAVDGGKIRRLDYVDGELEVKKDDAEGDYYLLPLVQKPINIFVKSGSGQTHALILQPKEIPLETIILKEPASRDARRSGSVERAGSLELAVKRLVLAMARGDKPNEFDIFKVNNEVGLWNEARFVLTERYVGRTLIGERYQLTNTSNTVMRIAEQELYKQGVVAVSIEAMVLNPGETTEVFIAKVNNDG